jgi:hypothetical protein
MFSNIFGTNVAALSETLSARILQETSGKMAPKPGFPTASGDIGTIKANNPSD